jgi:hypothetical protein
MLFLAVLVVVSGVNVMVTHDTPAAGSTNHSEPRTARPAAAIAAEGQDTLAKILGISAAPGVLISEVVSMRTVTIKDLRDGKVVRETTDVGQE